MLLSAYKDPSLLWLYDFEMHFRLFIRKVDRRSSMQQRWVKEWQNASQYCSFYDYSCCISIQSPPFFPIGHRRPLFSLGSWKRLITWLGYVKGLLKGYSIVNKGILYSNQDYRNGLLLIRSFFGFWASPVSLYLCGSFVHSVRKCLSKSLIFYTYEK